MRRLLTLLLLVASVSACADRPEAKMTVFVGVPPLRAVVQELVGPTYQVEVLLPAGASPETFEPQGKQLAELADAEALFIVGLPFEELVSRRLERGGTARKVVHLRAPSAIATDHPWLDPFSLLELAQSCGQWVLAQRPEESARVDSTLASMESRWKALDLRVRQRLRAAGTRAFVTVHPAYDAFAARYGLRQIALEVDGRTASGRSLVRLLESAREERASVMLIQPQHAARQAEAIARELGLRTFEIDPLQENVEHCMMELIDAIEPVNESR